MSISLVGTSKGTNTAAPVSHAIGDLIIISAFRATTGTPALPAGYTSILTKTGTTSSMRVGFKIATATNDAGGTWTNATATVCHVYRTSQYASGGSLFIGASASSNSSTNTVNYPALTLLHGDSTSWVLGFAGVDNTTETIQTNPVGLTNQVLQNSATDSNAGFDTTAAVSSWSSVNATTTGTAGHSVSCTIELIENQPGTALANIVQHIAFSYTNTNATGETDDLFVWQFDPTLAGNGLAFAVTYPSGLTPTVTDDKGNTWPGSPEVIADPGAGNVVLAFFHINNATTGTSQIKLDLGGNPSASVKGWVTQLYNVTGTVESANTWKLVGTAPTVGTISPTTITPTVDNCLVLSYMALSSNNVTTNPALIVAETGYNLNDADNSYGTNCFVAASQYTLQGAKAATTPRFYLNAGGTTDTYNIIAIALSTGSQGTAKPSGAGVAPWIDRILHFSNPGSAATTFLQIPATGNAAMLVGQLPGAGSTPHINTFIDNDGTTWTNNQPAGSTGLYACTRVNISSGRSNRNATVTFSATPSFGEQFVYYDISNADTAPVVASAGTTGSSTGASITPTGTNQLTIAYLQIGVGPSYATLVPSTAIFDLPTASSWKGTASIAGTALAITVNSWGTVFSGSPILSDAGGHVSGGATLTAGSGNAWTISSSQGTVASETMFLSVSDANTINYGNYSGHYFNGGNTSAQAWSIGVAQGTGGVGGAFVALIFAGPPAASFIAPPPYEILQAVKRASYW